MPQRDGIQSRNDPQPAGSVGPASSLPANALAETMELRHAWLRRLVAARAGDASSPRPAGQPNGVSKIARGEGAAPTFGDGASPPRPTKNSVKLRHKGIARSSRNQRSADSLVREFHATPKKHADKAVRAPEKSSQNATKLGDIAAKAAREP